MNHQRLLEHFTEKVLALGASGVTRSDVKLPNEIWEQNDRELWFEISAGEGDPVNHAEGVERRLVTVNVVCAVPIGSGTQRLNNIADRVSKMYTPLESARAGFTIGLHVFVVRRVTKYPAEQMTDGLKLNVRFVLELYTKEF